MRRSITAQFTAMLVVVSFVVIAGFAVMIISAGNLRTADRARVSTARGLVVANELEQSVLDLETGLRGYLLAGRPVFLEPYRQALGR